MTVAARIRTSGRTRGRALAFMGLSLLCAAWPAESAGQPVARRFAPDSAWVRVWAIRADSAPDLFIEPRRIAVSGDVVVVLDMGTREVRGLDARTGAHRFVVKARGEGPGEFKRPALLAATPTGWAVVDHATSRLTTYSRTGRAGWDVVIPDVFTMSDFCVRRDASVLVHHKRRDSSLVELDSAGHQRRVLTAPWQVVRKERAGFAHDAQLTEVHASGACALIPYFGREWAVAGGTGRDAARVHSYVEAGPEPVIERKEQVLERSLTRKIVQATEMSTTDGIARDGLVLGDTIIVQGATTKQHSHRLLDYYDVRSGRYLYSRKLPLSADALAIGADGTFYAALIREGGGNILAFRPAMPPTPTSTPTPAKAPAAPSRAGTPARPPSPAR